MHKEHQEMFHAHEVEQHHGKEQTHMHMQLASVYQLVACNRTLPTCHRETDDLLAEYHQLAEPQISAHAVTLSQDQTLP